VLAAASPVAPLVNLKAEAWCYNSPEGPQGPASLEHLASYKPQLEPAGWWPLRVWQSGGSEADAVPITALLPPEWR